MKQSVKGKQAGNKQADKLSEARSVLGDHYNDIAYYNEKGRKSGANFNWIEPFEKGMESQPQFEAMKQAKEAYKTASGSISQYFLSIVRKTGNNQEKFQQVYDAMKTVWKVTKNQKVPQSVMDAASIINRAFTRSINPCKATSVEVLKKQISEHDKGLDKDKSAGTVDTALNDTLKDLNSLANVLRSTDIEQYNNLIASLKSISAAYQPAQAETVSNKRSKKAA